VNFISWVIIKCTWLETAVN